MQSDEYVSLVEATLSDSTDNMLSLLAADLSGFPLSREVRQEFLHALAQFLTDRVSANLNAFAGTLASSVFLDAAELHPLRLALAEADSYARQDVPSVSAEEMAAIDDELANTLREIADISRQLALFSPEASVSVAPAPIGSLQASAGTAGHADGTAVVAAVHDVTRAASFADQATATLSASVSSLLAQSAQLKGKKAS
jgi:hypothetical protein